MNLLSTIEFWKSLTSELLNRRKCWNISGCIERAEHTQWPLPRLGATASSHFTLKFSQLCIRSIDWAGLRGSHKTGEVFLAKTGRNWARLSNWQRTKKTHSEAESTRTTFAEAQSQTAGRKEGRKEDAFLVKGAGRGTGEDRQVISKGGNVDRMQEGKLTKCPNKTGKGKIKQKETEPARPTVHLTLSAFFWMLCHLHKSTSHSEFQVLHWLTANHSESCL